MRTRPTHAGMLAALLKAFTACATALASSWPITSSGGQASTAAGSSARGPAAMAACQPLQVCISASLHWCTGEPAVQPWVGWRHSSQAVAAALDSQPWEAL